MQKNNSALSYEMQLAQDSAKKWYTIHCSRIEERILEAYRTGANHFTYSVPYQIQDAPSWDYKDAVYFIIQHFKDGQYEITYEPPIRLTFTWEKLHKKTISDPKSEREAYLDAIIESGGKVQSSRKHRRHRKKH